MISRIVLVLLTFFAAACYFPDAAAQTPSPAKPAYLIVELQLNDPDGIKPYRDKVEETLLQYSGRFLVRGGQTILKVGGPQTWNRIVMIRFDTMAQALKWYDSPAYQAILPFRLKSGEAQAYFVEGLPE